MDLEELKKLRAEVADEQEQADAKLNTADIQTAFERTWETIKHSGTVKDLTNLTTQDEIYHAVENGGSGYKITRQSSDYVIVGNVYKNDTYATLPVSVNILSLKYFYQLKVEKNGGALGDLIPTQLSGLSPTHSESYTNKSYVDNKVSSIPTPKIMIRQIDTLGTTEKAWLAAHWDNIITATVRPYSYIGKNDSGFWENTFINSTEPIVASWWHGGTSYGPSEDKSIHELRASFNIPTHYDDGQYNVGYMSLKKDGTGFGKIWVQSVGGAGRSSASYSEHSYDDVWTFTYLELS